MSLQKSKIGICNSRLNRISSALTVFNLPGSINKIIANNYNDTLTPNETPLASVALLTLSGPNRISSQTFNIVVITFKPAVSINNLTQTV